MPGNEIKRRTPAAQESVPIGPPEAARDDDIAAIADLNNTFAPQGLTLMRSEEFVENHLADYRVIRGPGGVVGCVALDDYSPSLVELVSLAVSPEAQGMGLGRKLMAAIEDLAAKRGYPQIFAVSFSDDLFLGAGYEKTSVALFPEKEARYANISRAEIKIGRKHCFAKRLTEYTSARQMPRLRSGRDGGKVRSPHSQPPAPPRPPRGRRPRSS